MKINWKTLLPEKQNNYTGSKISLYFLIIWAWSVIVGGAIHIFAPDGGAGLIAGFDLTNDGTDALLPVANCPGWTGNLLIDGYVGKLCAVYLS